MKRSKRPPLGEGADSRSAIPDATLGSLEQRLEELGALTDWPIPRFQESLDPRENAIRVALSLADALEWSERRFIESNVKLLSLREVASSLIALRDPEEVTLAVGRYFVRAFGFEKFFLLSPERAAKGLSGHWIEQTREGSRFAGIRLPSGGRGPLAAAYREGKNLLLEGTAAREAVSDLRVVAEIQGASGGVDPEAGSLIALPLVHVHSGERSRPDDRREGYAHLGLIGVARSAGRGTLTEEDLLQVSSLAFTVSAVLANARLYQAVREGEQLRQHILNSIPSGLVVLDGEGKTLIWNRTASRVTGYAARDVIGEKAAVLSAGGSKAAELLDRTLQDGRVFTRQETVLERRDGASVPISISTSLLTDEEGRMRGVIGTFLDLTSIKELEEKIRRLDRLAALGRFTAGVAHEIRNPLAGIAAGVEVLRRGFEAADGRHEHVGFILSEIERLNRIVDDLCRATRTREAHPAPSPLAPVLERALRSVSRVFEERKVAVRSEIARELPDLPIDGDMIQQVFINLLKNAAEASEDGGEVAIEMRLLADGSRSGSGRVVRTAFVDRGRGVSAERRKRLFEPFFTDKPGGTGLGLYLCHSIVEEHGGALRLESPPEGGATFVVELPAPVDTGRSIGNVRPIGAERRNG